SRSATAHALTPAGSASDSQLRPDPAAPTGQQLRRRVELVGAVLVVAAIGLALGGRFVGHPTPASPQLPALGPTPAALHVDLSPAPPDLQAVALDPAQRPIHWSIQTVPPGADII